MCACARRLHAKPLKLHVAEEERRHNTGGDGECDEGGVTFTLGDPNADGFKNQFVEQL